MTASDAVVDVVIEARRISALTNPQMPEEGARRALKGVSAKVRDEMALLYVADQVRGIMRQSVAAKERAARTRGRRAGQSIDADYDAIEREHRQNLSLRVAEILSSYVEDLKVAWTDDLLDMSFALPNGQLVLWGQATVGHHEQRALMFSEFAVGNLQGAAMHLKAISDLRKSNAVCLDFMLHRHEDVA